MPLTKTVFFKVLYSLSEKAVSDLDGIYEYTILNFGLEQARAYLLGLRARKMALEKQRITRITKIRFALIRVIRCFLCRSSGYSPPYGSESEQ